MTQGDAPVTHFRKREAHARIPDSVLYDSTVSLEAKAVYAALARHAFKGGLAFIGNRKLAVELNTSQSTIARKLMELEASEHLKITREVRGRRAAYQLTSSVFDPVQAKPKRIYPKRMSSTQRAASLAAGSRKALDDILGAGTA